MNRCDMKKERFEVCVVYLKQDPYLAIISRQVISRVPQQTQAAAFFGQSNQNYFISCVEKIKHVVEVSSFMQGHAMYIQVQQRKFRLQVEDEVLHLIEEIFCGRESVHYVEPFNLMDNKKRFFTLEENFNW